MPANRLYTSLTLPEGASNAPVVMMASGDGPDGVASGTYLTLAADLAAIGIGTYIFDFEGLGQSPGSARALTLSRGIANFRQAAERLFAQTGVDITRLGLFASSYGAAVALESAGIVNRFQAAVFKSPVSSMADAYMANLTEEELEDWRTTGYSRKFQRTFDSFEDAKAYTTSSSIASIATPSLILHGAADSLVTPKQSQRLLEELGKDISPRPHVELSLLPGVNHTFSPKAWTDARGSVVNWFASHLIQVQQEPQSPHRRTH